MDLAFFIARRMARPAPENRPGVMERIAVGSVALGIAVMILSLAVVLGFKREVAHRMEGFAAHVALTDIRGVDALDSQPVRRNPRVEALVRGIDAFVAMAPYAVKGGIIRTDEAVGEVVLKGVGPDYDLSHLREWLVGGELPGIGDSIRKKDILLARVLADRLKIRVGDKVVAPTYKGDRDAIVVEADVPLYTIDPDIIPKLRTITKRQEVAADGK